MGEEQLRHPGIGVGGGEDALAGACHGGGGEEQLRHPGADGGGGEEALAGSCLGGA